MMQLYLSRLIKISVLTFSTLVSFSAFSKPHIPLKTLYEDKFLIGNILSGGMELGETFRQDRKELGLLVSQFNCLTAENSMKMAYMQPVEGEYNFTASDALVSLAEAADMEVVGHALVWHHQVPNWIFKNKSGGVVSRELLIERMRDHIFTIMERYKGRIKYWDVVNEAVDLKRVNGKQVAFLRESPWYKIIGEDYLEMAYRFAQEADPDALLLYNDFSMTDLPKTKFVAQMIKDLKAKGIKMHGVGMQAHWHLEYPMVDEIKTAFDILSEADVQISITELDMRVLPHVDGGEGADIDVHHERRKELDPYTNGIPASVLKEQADRYAEIFKVFLEYSDQIERVSFWGVLDQYSWLRNWPVPNRTAYPALFDRDYNPKPAYFAIRKLVE